MKNLSLFVMVFFCLQLPGFSQIPQASPWVNKMIKLHNARPDWNKVVCKGMRDWNSNTGKSYFSDYAFQMVSTVDPVVARHGKKDFVDFYFYIAANYCPDVW